MATFESQNRRMPKIEACLKANGLESLDACNEMLLAKGIDCDKIIRGIQPICFENACWAYTVGAAIALKSGVTTAAEAAKKIGSKIAERALAKGIEEVVFDRGGHGVGEYVRVRITGCSSATLFGEEIK